jgi:hypothetical protein
MDQDRIRELIARVDLEISGLQVGASLTENPTPAGGLVDAWDDLISALGLGTAPAVRECPRCQRTIMRLARLCGHCWMTLTPLPSDG